ncbi:MAG: hypothetical protein ACLT2C_09375, partial [Ruminococcus sp.]
LMIIVPQSKAKVNEKEEKNMDSKITTYYTMDSKGLHFYYKVRDALIFGGEGSVGYCTATVNATKESACEILAFYAVQSRNVAASLDVDFTQLESISREDYETLNQKD